MPNQRKKILIFDEDYESMVISKSIWSRSCTMMSC